eukprot:73992_1
MVVFSMLFPLFTLIVTICLLCDQSHAELPLDETTTSTQIIQSLDEQQTLTGRLAIVTGGTSGLGKETVRSLALLDCAVIMAVRNTQKALNVKNDIIHSILKGQHMRTTRDKLEHNIHIIKLDLASLSSILDFAKHVYRNYAQSIDYLFNNAAIMAVPEFTQTKDGFEQQIGVNYLGHYYLTRLLMDKLLQRRNSNQPARVISVSSRAHKYATQSIGNAVGAMRKTLADDSAMQVGYDGWGNYGISKAFQILFARELQRRMGKKGIVSVSLHPGVIKSGLQQYLTEDYIETKTFDKSVEQGTATQLWVALMPLQKVVPGGYYYDCQFHDDLLRDDLQPVNGYLDEGFDAINTLENSLWDVSEKLIQKKGFTFSYKDTKDDL